MGETDVLVVGAGPVGLALACELRRFGLSFRLVEVLDEPVVWSKAAVVHVRTMEILDGLGIAREFADRSKALHGFAVHAEGKRVLHVPFDEVESCWPHPYGISQRETEALLGRRLLELGGTVERSTRLEALRQDEHGVTATLEKKSKEREDVRARWIVGTDGAHSTVRHALDVPFEGAPYEEKIIQTDARVEWPHPMPQDEILAFLSPDGPVACFPFFQDGRYRVLKLFTGEAPDREPVLEDFQRMLGEHVRGVKVSDPAWITSFRLHHRLAARFRVGRAFLAGDAAHIHSPAGGQGMNTGIQDAHNLAWKLALVARDVARPALLDSYEAERRPIAEELLRGTDLATRAVGQVVKLRNPIALGLRNGLMALASRLSFVGANAARTLSMLDRNYRGSPIVSEHRRSLLAANVVGSPESELPSLAAWAAFGKGPEPGDRAPDVAYDEAPGGARLFELLDPSRHTLLLFDGEAATESGYRNLAGIAGSVKERCGEEVVSRLVLPGERSVEAAHFPGLVVRDTRKALHDRFGARSECLYLIRPDGHVAFRSQPADVERLLAYLDTIFI